MSQIQASQEEQSSFIQSSISEDMDLFMEDSSVELQEYISKLKLESSQSNPKSLCCYC